MLGSRRLTEPFFADTLQANMVLPFHQLFRHTTSMEKLLAWTDAHPSAPLKGLIFHTSRCGSTLVSQQIAALESSIVASEPSPFDAVLRIHRRMPALPRPVHLRWLRAVAAALGQARAGETAFYIKTDCWHIHEIDVILEAFPAVPWIFIYRDPLEVLQSQHRVPAAWTIPSLLDSAALRLDVRDWDPSQRDVYCARALGLMCEAALGGARSHSRGLLVNYSELPEATCERLLTHFGLPAGGIPAMRRRALQDAKSPQTTFVPDAELPRDAGTVSLESAVAKYLQEPYGRLEAARHHQMQSNYREDSSRGLCPRPCGNRTS
jgi:hypothetical protein